MKSVERVLQRDIDRWVYLLGLGAWRITWDISDRPLIHEGEAVAATADYKRKRSGYQVARLRFDRTELTSPAKIERLVIHELLHILDRGLGNDAHRLIYRLEQPLRRMRRRLSK